jgi:undecaprenyl-diphosphatase
MQPHQALLFAVIQGVTELFPVSSVAHGVLTPYLFGWTLDTGFLKEQFLPFVVMLHLGTAVALLVFFWRDWLALLSGAISGRVDGARRTLALIAVATLPAAVLGLAFEKPLRALFSSVPAAAAFLIANGLLLFFGERLRGRGTAEIRQLGFVQAGLIGAAQSLALLPGFSRSGASMVAGFWMGLRHEAAARFSMLLATPIIAGAGVLEVPRLLRSSTAATLQTALLGGAAAGICALAAVWALMRWFGRHEVDAMRLFAIYCWAVGATVLAVHML